MRPIKIINKDIKALIKAEKYFIELYGQPNIGIMLITEDGYIYYFNLMNFMTGKPIPLNEHTMKELLIYMHQQNIKDITDYYVLTVDKRSLASTGVLLQRKDHDIVIPRLSIVYGCVEKEMIRDYYLPSFVEDKRMRKRLDGPTIIRKVLDPILIPDAGIFKPDISSSQIQDKMKPDPTTIMLGSKDRMDSIRR